MVGRLVEQEEVGLGGEGPAERDPALLPAGERGDRVFERRGVQFGDQRLNAHLEIPAVGVVDEVEQLGQLCLAALARFIPANRRDQVGRSRLDVLADGEGVIEFEFLGEVTDPDAALGGNLSAVRLFLSGQDLEQAGLAAAVASHQAGLLSGFDGDGRPLEQLLVTVSELEGTGGEESGHGGAGRW